MPHCPLYWFGPQRERAHAPNVDHCQAKLGGDDPVPIPESWAQHRCKGDFPACPTYAAIAQAREVEAFHRVLAERDRVLGRQFDPTGSS
jgi:hypothetical protein